MKALLALHAAYAVDMSCWHTADPVSMLSHLIRTAVLERLLYSSEAPNKRIDSCGHVSRKLVQWNER